MPKAGEETRALAPEGRRSDDGWGSVRSIPRIAAAEAAGLPGLNGTTEVVP